MPPIPRAKDRAGHTERRNAQIDAEIDEPHERASSRSLCDPMGVGRGPHALRGRGARRGMSECAGMDQARPRACRRWQRRRGRNLRRPLRHLVGPILPLGTRSAGPLRGGNWSLGHDCCTGREAPKAIIPTAATQRRSSTEAVEKRVIRGERGAVVHRP